MRPKITDFWKWILLIFKLSLPYAATFKWNKLEVHLITSLILLHSRQFSTLYSSLSGVTAADVCMYVWIFIQDSPFSSYWTVINGGPAWEGPRVFKVPIWTTEANFIATAQLDNHPSGSLVTLSSWVLSWV